MVSSTPRRSGPTGSAYGVTLKVGATGRSPLQGVWILGQARNDAQTGLLDPYALALVPTPEVVGSAAFTASFLGTFAIAVGMRAPCFVRRNVGLRCANPTYRATTSA